MQPLELFVAELLADHCMPTLLKAKPSSMISVKIKDISDHTRFSNILNTFADRSNCRCYLLCKWDDRLYYIIYQEELLTKCLLLQENKSFLLSCHYIYPEYDISNSILSQLKLRYYNYFENKAFPHEIGIILGYPLADVEGFINNDGRNYLLSGMWKVYQDVDRAKQLFSMYHKMKEDARLQLQEGFIFNYE